MWLRENFAEATAQIVGRIENGGYAVSEHHIAAVRGVARRALERGPCISHRAVRGRRGARDVPGGEGIGGHGGCARGMSLLPWLLVESQLHGYLREARRRAIGRDASRVTPHAHGRFVMHYKKYPPASDATHINMSGLVQPRVEPPAQRARTACGTASRGRRSTSDRLLGLLPSATRRARSVRECDVRHAQRRPARRLLTLRSTAGCFATAPARAPGDPSREL